MDQDTIDRLARGVLTKYRLGADFKMALAEAARSYLAQYKGRTFGQVMGAIAKATRKETVRGCKDHSRGGGLTGSSRA